MQLLERNRNVEVEDGQLGGQLADGVELFVVAQVEDCGRVEDASRKGDRFLVNGKAKLFLEFALAGGLVRDIFKLVEVDVRRVGRLQGVQGNKV